MRGFLIVRLPAEVLKSARKAVARFLRFFAGSNAEKVAYRTPQDGERVLGHPGYLTPSPGWAELFEVRRSQRDAAYRFPPGCEHAGVELFDQLRALALRWLAALSMHLCGDEHTLPALAASDTGPATLRVIHYDQVPQLACELESVAREDRAGQRREVQRTIMAGFPSHTDSSLLTLGPRATLSGLAVRDATDNRWHRIERAMAEDEAVLFCGDALSFASRHYFPACMHRPDGMEMCRGAPGTRVSTPFFLYADREAVLDSSRTRSELRAADGMALPSPLPPRLTVRDFTLNVNNCRQSWPWKQQPYYSGLVLCRDSDDFPGLELEGDMEYADE